MNGSLVPGKKAAAVPMSRPSGIRRSTAPGRAMSPAMNRCRSTRPRQRPGEGPRGRSTSHDPSARKRLATHTSPSRRARARCLGPAGGVVPSLRCRAASRRRCARMRRSTGRRRRRTRRGGACPQPRAASGVGCGYSTRAPTRRRRSHRRREPRAPRRSSPCNRCPSGGSRSTPRVPWSRRSLPMPTLGGAVPREDRS